jgi:hypothetical protein
MDILVLSKSVPIQLKQNTSTKIDKTNMSSYDWTYQHYFIPTDIVKTDMSKEIGHIGMTLPVPI